MKKFKEIFIVFDDGTCETLSVRSAAEPSDYWGDWIAPRNSEGDCGQPGGGLDAIFGDEDCVVDDVIRTDEDDHQMTALFDDDDTKFCSDCQIKCCPRNFNIV